MTGSRRPGKDAFARRGVRGTTVDELAWAAAISKGAFYRFFDSKESLLLALLDDYEITMQAEIVEAVRREPGRGIDVLIDSALHAIGHNPLLPVLMSEEGLQVSIPARLPSGRRCWNGDVRLVEWVLAVLQEAGITLTVSDRVLLGLLRSLVFVGRHRPDIGEDLVDEVGGWLKRTMRTALLPSSEQGAR